MSDSERFEYIIERGAVRAGVVVELSGTPMACDANTLPSTLDDAVRTEGRLVVEAYAGEATMARVVRVAADGIAAVQAA